MIPALPLLLLLSAAPTPTRIMLMPLAAGEGVPEKTADAVTDALAAELRRQPGLQVMTRKEIAAVLSLERQKALLGCQTDSCLAELGGALDAERLISGNIAKLGESWMLHLQLLDARKVAILAYSDRRHRGGSVDDLLDALPAMVHEILPTGVASAAVSTPAPAPPAPAPAALPAPAKVAPQPWADEPLEPSKIPAHLVWVTDSAGRYVAFDPSDSDAPIFSGDGHTLYVQRVYAFSGGSGGQREYLFWEPRTPVRYDARFTSQDGTYTLICGKRKIALGPVPQEKAQALLKGARFLKPRWHRQGYALARDGEGTYYYVDRPLESEGDPGFQLYIGTQGQMHAVESRVLASDAAGDVIATDTGKLRLSHDNHEAEWLQGQERRLLTYLPLDRNFSQVTFVYTKLGVYKGERLGTPCDGAL